MPSTQTNCHKNPAVMDRGVCQFDPTLPDNPKWSLTYIKADIPFVTMPSTQTNCPKNPAVRDRGVCRFEPKLPENPK